MIHHLQKYESEAAAIEHLAAYRSEVEWRGDIIIPNQRVWKPGDDVVSVVDGAEVRAPQYFPFHYVTVILPEISEELAGHPSCILAWDDQARAVLFTAIPEDMLADYMLSPVPAGANYPFGQSL